MNSNNKSGNYETQKYTWERYYVQRKEVKESILSSNQPMPKFIKVFGSELD